MADRLMSVEELQDRMGVPIPDDKVKTALAVLQDASALVRLEAGKTWETESPPEVVLVVVGVSAIRAFSNPGGVVDSESISADAYSVTYGTRGVYLTAAERDLIHKAVGSVGLWTLSTTRQEDNISDVPDVFPLYPGMANTWANLGTGD